MLEVDLKQVIEKARDFDKPSIELLAIIAKQYVKMGWHSLEDNPNDLPEKDGLYECRVLMKNGTTRIASKVSYKIKPKIIYWKDECGNTHKKIKPSGWRTSGNFAWDRILEWRNRDENNITSE